MEFYYCDLIPSNCLGNDTCAEGAIGIKCENCDLSLGYSKNSSGKCSKCQ